MVGSTWFLSEQMQGHCYPVIPEHMASALSSQHNYRLTLSCPVIVVVYFVCAHLHSSNSVHYLLWCFIQSMFSIIYVYVFKYRATMKQYKQLVIIFIDNLEIMITSALLWLNFKNSVVLVML